MNNMTTKYWLKYRPVEGTHVFVADKVDEDDFPFMILTDESCGALGEMVCLCSSPKHAKRVLEALSVLEALREIEAQKLASRCLTGPVNKNDQ